ncbi:MAG: rhomboid family intramembrane serine protease [Bacteroides sp.]|nr:rhomboid family intramembrane serine protease [Bacteroides sp.]
MRIRDYFKAACGESKELRWLLIVIAVTGLVCFLWQIIAALSGLESGVFDSWFALSSDFKVVMVRPWTLATYLCLHYSVLHLIFNILWLLCFGSILTRFHPGRLLLQLFIGGGIAGGIFYIVSASFGGAWPGSYLTGDSAAVLSVMSACAVLMPGMPIRLFLFGEVKLKWVAAVCILLTIFGGGGSTAVSIAHVCGALWGVGQGWYVKKGKIIFNHKFHNNYTNLSVKHKSHNPSRAAQAMNTLDDHRRLDELLDKIRLSGYDSLSEREKIELNHISSRITK